MKAANKLVVEIWSDVMCPFCYTGKRNFEQAVEKTALHSQIELVWKSFQLDPSLEDAPDKNPVDYLSERKGISPEQVKGMHASVTAMAAKAGLEYHLDKTRMVNSYKAHRVLQKAKEKGLGDAMEEQLFYANFTEGKNFADADVLISLGEKIGLSKTDIDEALGQDKYAEQVDLDIREAAELGISGVPFFVFDRKFAVSGAQPPEAFVRALEQTNAERKKSGLQTIEGTDGAVCDTDGNCN